MLHRLVRGFLARRGLPCLWRAVMAAGLLLAALPGAATAGDETQPYGVDEFVVHIGPGLQARPLVSGGRAFWQEGVGQEREIRGRNLATGQDFMFTTSEVHNWYDVDGDVLVASESTTGGLKGIYGYRLAASSSRFDIAPMEGEQDPFRLQPAISGNVVAWAEGKDAMLGMDIYGHDIASGKTFPICTDPAQQEWPAVSGNLVVWQDARNRGGSSLPLRDLYGYDLAAGREFRITARPEMIGAPAISGNTVVWWAERDGAYRLIVYDVASKQESVLADLSYRPAELGVDIDGGLVVWNARMSPWGFADHGIYGYDLAQKKPFVVCRAVGDQVLPRIAGRTVVWADARNRGLNKYDQEYDIYAATLTDGPAPVPPVTGAPAAADAKIQIVWPHGGVPVTQADKANIAAYLLRPGTLRPSPCQWAPQVYLWRAIDNGPARIAASGGRRAYEPIWEFNDVDVAAARDPQNRIYFFITLVGAASRTNVWAHAADARTYFPHQDVPTGTGLAGPAVDASIQIVWPHDGAPVSQAERANITAKLFLPNTLTSVAPEWNPTVRLWRALNNGVGEAVAVGEKRLVSENGVTYPVWDFNDVDVSAARDPMNKYYFRLSVDDAETYSNVWAHGADARTYFPHQDALDGSCQ